MKGGGRLKVKPLKISPGLRNMPDEEAAYFSWFTFERLFEKGIDESLQKLLKERLIVTTTRPHVERPDLAVAGVGARDREIGRLAGELIINSELGKLGAELRETPIAEPLYYRWINCDTALKRNVRFPRAVLNHPQTECFGDWARIVLEET